MSDATKYTNKLKDKRFLIVGGSAGIGYGVAEAVVELGGYAIVSSSQKSRVEAAVSELQSSYPSKKDRVSGFAYSMGDQSVLEKNVVSLLNDSTQSGSKKLDHIVWTAGDSLAVIPLSELSLDKLQQAGTVRFYGPVMLAKHAPKYLNPGPASSIVLTTGSVSQKPIPGWSAIGAYATALHGLNRGLALDLKPLRVNLVSPGAVNTPLWDGLPEEHRKQMFKASEEKSTTGRVGRVEDVVEAFLFAMKDQNCSGELIGTNSGALLV
ncbi:NAD(P)-binding protein [Myriangium duriaei CBS 260.36]|uniref:NAD(P)-binding protein n=1 Tax=Myriangium duriaei CBS 260.36 TaxID=1168546 RepID=A0A9P4J7Q2_9PEZI|nr:NAD(P)-binding protein [Myriangium duriaei CBS 260.36]